MVVEIEHVPTGPSSVGAAHGFRPETGRLAVGFRPGPWMVLPDVGEAGVAKGGQDDTADTELLLLVGQVGRLILGTRHLGEHDVRVEVDREPV